MTRRPHNARTAALLGGWLGLSALGGCISLLPKQAPVQLYQFGRMPPPSAQASTSVGRGQDKLGVSLSQVSLPRAATGDAILTTRGEEAAYLAGARWLSPAALMWQEDAEQAFAAQAQRVRLVARSELGAASVLLRLDVAEFDARYDPAGAGPPVVVVSLRATLARPDAGRLVQQGFTVRRAASQDRVSAIVSAYDQAVQDALAQVVGWTDAQTLAPVADVASPPAPVSGAAQGLPPGSLRRRPS